MGKDREDDLRDSREPMPNLKERAIFKTGQAAKICVSIAAAEEDAIISEASSSLQASADMIEWRADAYRRAGELPALSRVLNELRRKAPDMPLLFTYRTADEGGEGSATPEVYKEVNKAAIDSGCIDLIDIQLFSEPDVAEELIDYAHSKGVAVVASYHDFEGTPSADEIYKLFEKPQGSEADIIKIAVMSEDEEAVERLLEASTKVRENFPDCPIIAIAMGEAGMISRIEAERFGSCIIYAAGSKKTAPGQLDADELRRIRSERI